ncbi:MAG: hypothetical protein IJU28_05570 [Clostridia bacterium]|nr:hypothetical protein [Clostridia bacterium]
MKNNDFRELVDRDLSGLVWDEQKRQRVRFAIHGEEKNMKKFSTTFILVAVILGLTISALAAGIGLIFSKKVDNDKLADDSLLTKYGITSEMLSFFSRSYEENEGDVVIRYEGVHPFTYVLGTYTVMIKDGKAEADWNHKESETSGGFAADAWGAEQLSEMLRISHETHNVSQFAQTALMIAAKHNTTPTAGLIPELIGNADGEQELEERRQAEAAQGAAKLSVPEMEKLAREAISLRYGFDTEQAACLMCQEDNGRYLLFGDDALPCYEFFFTLGFLEDGYQGASGVGVYHVTVNVVNGTIEDILYDSDLAGEG